MNDHFLVFMMFLMAVIVFISILSMVLHYHEKKMKNDKASRTLSQIKWPGGYCGRLSDHGFIEDIAYDLSSRKIGMVCRSNYPHAMYGLYAEFYSYYGRIREMYWDYDDESEFNEALNSAKKWVEDCWLNEL